ncbi:FtsX-like permease family protein [Patescibacteria group bacterium]|nr:FtsX-like permease family protein [Patescibacteria group bacterium]MBU1867956.1 FtsX-like permease family protein [Patescibacteria group bacterium]
MKFSSLFIIALKTLFGKKLRSLLTIGGVTVGIGAIVFLVSLGYGIQLLIVERITGLDALRVIDISTVKSKIIRLNGESLRNLNAIEGVELIEPLISLPGKISFGGSSTDIVVFGASPDYLKLSSIKASVGTVYEADKNQVVVNKAVLKLVGVEENKYDMVVGEKASLELWILPELLSDDSAEKSTKLVKEELEITGVIDDNETPYTFLPFDILKNKGVENYSQAKLRVENKSQLEDVRGKVESLGFSTMSAVDTVQQIDQIFSIFRIVLASFGAIALIVAALGMFNTLTVSLLERTREVGLMKALGAKRKDVFALFLSEALIISCIGGALGILFGYGLGEGANFVLNRLAYATGNEPVDVFHTPVIFALGVVIFAVIVGFTTGLYPSRRASGLNPLDALRYE